MPTRWSEATQAETRNTFFGPKGKNYTTSQMTDSLGL